jgi:hypothetical protein
VGGTSQGIPAYMLLIRWRHLSRIELLREKQNSTRSPQPTSDPTIPACESQAASTERLSQPQDDRGARNSTDPPLTPPSPIASSTGSNISDGQYPTRADLSSTTISHDPRQARVPCTGSIGITIPVPVDASGSSFGSAHGQTDSPKSLSYSRGHQEEFGRTPSHVASAAEDDIVQMPSDGLWLGTDPTGLLGRAGLDVFPTKFS